jgi:hypothetical protein
MHTLHQVFLRLLHWVIYEIREHERNHWANAQVLALWLIVQLQGDVDIQQ